MSKGRAVKPFGFEKFLEAELNLNVPNVYVIVVCFIFSSIV